MLAQQYSDQGQPVSLTPMFGLCMESFCLCRWAHFETWSC